jgi:hypothetical protein
MKRKVKEMQEEAERIEKMQRQAEEAAGRLYKYTYIFYIFLVLSFSRSLVLSFSHSLILSFYSFILFITTATPNSNPNADHRSIYIGSVCIPLLPSPFSPPTHQVDYLATAEELQAHFQGCGTIERVTIMTDRFTGHPKGYVFFFFLLLSSSFFFFLLLSSSFFFFLLLSSSSKILK